MKKFLSILLIAATLSVLSACEKSSSPSAVPQTRVYFCQSTDSEMPASVTLLEDNKFQFFFSPLSSYYGVGTYTIDGDVLTLNTDDGNYHYTFLICDSYLEYDAENSSEYTWLADIADGAIFK